MTEFTVHCRMELTIGNTKALKKGLNTGLSWVAGCLLKKDLV